MAEVVNVMPVVIYHIGCFRRRIIRAWRNWRTGPLLTTIQYKVVWGRFLSTHTNNLVGVMWRLLHGPKAVQ